MIDENSFLCALLEATERWEADEAHARWDGNFKLIGHASGLKPPLLGAVAQERVRPGLIDDLAERGDLRVDPPQAGVTRMFALTAGGRRRARSLIETCPHTDAADLSWAILLARLTAFVQHYELAGAPEKGLPLDKASPHMRLLFSTGYLEETSFRTAHQTFVRPTAKALAQTRAWPSALRVATDAVEQLALQLADSPQPEAASLRQALGAGGRDLLVDVLAAVLAKQSGLA